MEINIEHWVNYRYILWTKNSESAWLLQESSVYVPGCFPWPVTWAGWRRILLC